MLHLINVAIIGYLSQSLTAAYEYNELNHGNFDPQDTEQYYQFGYQVNQENRDGFYGHMEMADGRLTTGQYKIQLPDGRLQIVSYEADDLGFRPIITYQDNPNFVPTPESEESFEDSSQERRPITPQISSDESSFEQFDNDVSLSVNNQGLSQQQRATMDSILQALRSSPVPDQSSLESYDDYDTYTYNQESDYAYSPSYVYENKNSQYSPSYTHPEKPSPKYSPTYPTPLPDYKPHYRPSTTPAPNYLEQNYNDEYYIIAIEQNNEPYPLYVLTKSRSN